ncbi:MAG TPA: hypothetical protein VLB44_19030 [Kofleriaceae bacterium]|nr:hypothetical protein [Kofleriaceae bacterium]
MLRATTMFLLLVGSITQAAAAPTTAGTAATIDRTELRRALVEERKVNLERFHAYRKKRIYPHNTYEPGMLNVWRDADDHLCAVATLVHLDGKDDLVDTLARDQNFVKTADLTDGPLIDWVLTSGFTQEEVVMIQAPTAADVEAMEAEYRAEQRRIKRWLKREDTRLSKTYRTVEKTLSTDRIADAGLDLATARLAQHPELAQALLAKHPH